MRNLTLIGAILLVSASAPVCECWRTKNPVSVLNKYLVENVVSDDFADNMEAIVKYEPGPRDKQVEQLASLLTNLDRTFELENLCSGLNLKTLRETFKAVHSYDKESFKEPKVNMRLNGLLYKYFVGAWDGCGRFYKQDWKQIYDRLEKLGLRGEIWYKVEHITRQHAFRFSWGTDDEYVFGGELRLSQGKWKPSAEELKEAFKEMQKHMKTKKEEAGKEERRSIDAAKGLVSKYLYEPCKVLLNDAEAKTILGPMTDLGAAWLLTGRSRCMWMSLRWAGRSLFCEWAIGKGEYQLAKMIL